MAGKEICARILQAVEKTCGKKRGKIRKFAELSGLDETSVRRWTQKVEPSPGPLAAIAKTAGVSMLWLATGEDPEPAKAPSNAVAEAKTPYGEDPDLFEIHVKTPVDLPAGSVIIARVHRVVFPDGKEG